MTLAADDLASVKTALARLAEPLLIELFGEPTTKRRRDWRWGRQGQPVLQLRQDGDLRPRGAARRVAARCDPHRAVLLVRGCALPGPGGGWTCGPTQGNRRLPHYTGRNEAVVPSNTAAIALNIWNEAEVITGTLGEVYLHARGLLLPDGAEMRFHPRCPREGGVQPAVIMLMRDIISNEPRAIQRRFLLPDGSKDGPALSLGSTSGTVWKLSPDGDVTLGLGIAEGHADALAAINDGFAPVWATGGAGGIAKFPVLGGIEALTIFRDRWRAGPQGSRAMQRQMAARRPGSRHRQAIARRRLRAVCGGPAMRDNIRALADRAWAESRHQAQPVRPRPSGRRPLERPARALGRVRGG